MLPGAVLILIVGKWGKCIVKYSTDKTTVEIKPEKMFLPFIEIMKHCLYFASLVLVPM